MALGRAIGRPVKWVEIRRENLPAAARFVQEDVRSPAARRLLATGGFTVLNHHAAQMDVRVSVKDPGFDADVNLMGLLNLLEGAREGGVRRVVFASSGGVVYGESDRLPHAETAPKLPVSPYGVSKLASEYYLAQYAILYGLAVRSLRYANVYGPRKNPHGEAGVVAIFERPSSPRVPSRKRTIALPARRASSNRRRPRSRSRTINGNRPRLRGRRWQSRP